MADLPDLDRARLAWWAVGAALGVALLFVLYSFVGTFVFAVFLYYATRPIYRRLKRRMGPPSLAAATALVLIALPALALAAYTTAIGLRELSKALENLSQLLQRHDVASPSDLGDVVATIQAYPDVSAIIDSPQQLVDGDLPAIARETFVSSLDFLLQYVGVVGNVLLHLFVTIAIAFYLLRDDHRLSRWFTRRFSDDRGVLAAYVRAVDEDFNNIFFGNILNAVFTAIIGAVSYNVLDLLATGSGVPYPTLLGLLTGAASLIPVVGMKLVYFPVAGYLFVRAAVTEPATALFAALFFGVSFVIVDTIPDLVLRPYVSGRNLHVGMVMFAYIFGPLLFGFYGIFLGPMILVLAVHFATLILPELIAGEPVQPWTVDPSHMVDVREPADAPSEAGSDPATDAEPAGSDDEALPESPTED